MAKRWTVQVFGPLLVKCQTQDLQEEKFNQTILYDVRIVLVANQAHTLVRC